MDSHLPSAGTTNPFATKYIRAGSLPYRFCEGSTLDELHKRLVRSQWRGQIVGPHGSGKTTLVRSLEARLCQSEVRSELFQLHNRQAFLPKVDWATIDRGTLVIIDGYEQLCTWSRWMIRSRCYRNGFGLLVTSHRPVSNLPILFKTSTTIELAEQLVEDLYPNSDLGQHTPPLFRKHAGNMREVFFELYDVVQRSRADSQSHYSH